MWNRFKTLDPWLFAVPIALMCISVVVIYGLTVDTVGSALYARQALYAGVGLLIMLFAAFIDYRSLKGWIWWLYGAGIAALIATRFLGKEDFGAKRWIDIGFFQFQPGELEKLLIGIVLAAFLGREAIRLSNQKFATALVLLGIPVLAVMLQPDLGTALVVASVGIGIFFHSKISRAQRIFLFGTLLAGALVIALSFHNVKPFSGFLKEYQKDRLASFVEPSRDKGGSGYNVLQSVIAVGSGGVTGKGFGRGSQSRLNFLPVAYADFIFAVIAETWGLVGTWGVIGLYVVLLVQIIQAARIAKDDFGMLICIGVAVKILFEVLVNIGMNIRVMPVTGIPLPFLSYGGTTMLTNALAIGLVQSVVIRYKRLTF